MSQISETASQNSFTGFSRLKLFFALSRTPHGLLDMCTPAFGALLWLGQFPSFFTVTVGLITTFAGYTAVYALNDVVDYKVDKEKAARGGLSSTGTDLDGLLVRHPMAQGFLTFKEGLFWSTAWSLLALIGALILNPVCVLIFVGGCALETIYCLLWRISPYRTFVSGAVKTSGAIAAVFAVDPNPSGMYLIVLFLLLFFWEIGGQNIPNDVSDLAEDISLKAKTIPVTFGEKGARMLIMGSLCATVVMSIIVLALRPPLFNVLSLAGAVGAGLYLLLLPAYYLYKSRDSAHAAVLFNRASYYPLAMLVIIAIDIMFVSG